VEPVNCTPSERSADRFASPVPYAADAEGDIDQGKLLAAWESATERLRQTHETLRQEVHRLTCELEVKNRELARKNRLADLGQMASHVAHEVRNSLTPLTLYMSLLRRYATEDERMRDLVDKIETGFTAMDATVNDLLHFTADRGPAWQRFDLRDLLDEVVDPLRPQLDAQRVLLLLDLPPKQRVWADRHLIRRAALNLVFNAVDAMPDGGELVITACETESGWELEIADSGPGLPGDLRDRIFEPFVTTKATGTGLGLAVVYRVANVHGGAITAANCPEGGAAFTLRIPHRHGKEVAA
jgi:signal transduction histidine kinase